MLALSQHSYEALVSAARSLRYQQTQQFQKPTILGIGKHVLTWDPSPLISHLPYSDAPLVPECDWYENDQIDLNDHTQLNSLLSGSRYSHIRLASILDDIRDPAVVLAQFHDHLYPGEFLDISEMAVEFRSSDPKISVPAEFKRYPEYKALYRNQCATDAEKFSSVEKHLTQAGFRIMGWRTRPVEVGAWSRDSKAKAGMMVTKHLLQKDIPTLRRDVLADNYSCSWQQIILDTVSMVGHLADSNLRLEQSCFSIRAIKQAYVIERSFFNNNNFNFAPGAAFTENHVDNPIQQATTEQYGNICVSMRPESLDEIDSTVSQQLPVMGEGTHQEDINDSSLSAKQKLPETCDSICPEVANEFDVVPGQSWIGMCRKIMHERKLQLNENSSIGKKTPTEVIIPDVYRYDNERADTSPDTESDRINGKILRANSDSNLDTESLLPVNNDGNDLPDNDWLLVPNDEAGHILSTIKLEQMIAANESDEVAIMYSIVEVPNGQKRRLSCSSAYALWHSAEKDSIVSANPKRQCADKEALSGPLRGIRVDKEYSVVSEPAVLFSTTVSTAST